MWFVRCLFFSADVSCDLLSLDSLYLEYPTKTKHLLETGSSISLVIVKYSKTIGRTQNFIITAIGQAGGFL